MAKPDVTESGRNPGVNDPHRDSSTRQRTPPGAPYYYDYIAVVIFCAFLICCASLVFLNVNTVGVCVEEIFGRRKAFILQLYFWAALGATIESYKFFAEDKERNELEDIKEHPDPNELRWPNSQDVVLYIQRILMSGAMGILGAAVLLAGLGVFDATQQDWGTKQKMGMIVFCVVVGMYQEDFLVFVSGVKEQFFKGKDGGAAAAKEDEAKKNRKAETEDLVRIREELRHLMKVDKSKADALAWITKEYPADKREEAYMALDYSKDPEVFITNPPGKDAKDILSKLLKRLQNS